MMFMLLVTLFLLTLGSLIMSGLAIVFCIVLFNDSKRLMVGITAIQTAVAAHAQATLDEFAAINVTVTNHSKTMRVLNDEYNRNRMITTALVNIPSGNLPSA